MMCVVLVWSDDTAEAIVHRIATYKDQTVPAIQHYGRVAGVVLRVTTTNKKPASYVFIQAEAKLDAAEVTKLVISNKCFNNQ